MNTGFWRASVPHGSTTFALGASLAILFSIILSIPTAAAPADDSPPVIDLIDSEGHALRDGSVFDSGDIEITCLVLDDLSEIVDVEYSIDGSPLQPTTTNGDIHRTSISLIGLTEGGHMITVRAMNSADLYTDKTVEFTVDSSGASSEDMTAWDILGAVAAIAGISIALVLLARDKRKEPKPATPIIREGEMPPIP